MTTADRLEVENGVPVLHHTVFQAMAEAWSGDGYMDAGDLKVTAGSNANAYDVAATTRGVRWQGSTYTFAGATNTASSSSNSSGSPRWDLVYYDTADSTNRIKVREGTAATKPDAPEFNSDEIPLALVYLADGTSDVTNSEIYNIRLPGRAAEDSWIHDSEGEFSSSTVASALNELIREQGDPLNGPLDLSSFSGSAPFDLGTNPGAFGAIVDMVVDSNSAAGTEHSFLFAADGSSLLKAYVESDGAGGIQNARLDLVGTPLYNGTTQIYDASTDTVLQGRLGGPASSLSSYPLPIGDLNNPYGLPTITDMDAAGNNLTDSSGPGTLYDATAGEFPRGVLDDEKTVTTVTSSTYTTSDEEVVLVDTATIAATSTITLASSDAESGHETAIIDISGSAATYPITVDTGGTETINGQSSYTIASPYTGATFSSDGSNWVTASPAPLDPKKQVEGAESGAVSANSEGTLIFDHLADGETLEIYKAIFTLDDGTAVPTGLDLVIATLDNAGGHTVQTTIYSGDGSTIWDGDAASRGDPLASYSNTSGAGQTVAVLADNTTSSAYSIMAKSTGERKP